MAVVCWIFNASSMSRNTVTEPQGQGTSRSGSPASDSIWCVIPVFNNKDTVRSVACACRKELGNVVVVDDGSTDADVNSLLEDTGINVIRHEENRGKGCAILTGLAFVREHGGVTMITIDADGQHLPADIRVLLPVIAANPTAIVIGARRMEAPDVPASSRFGMRFSDFWIRLETGVGVLDSQSGFRAYPVEYVSQLRLHGRRYDFEAEVLTRAAWAGLGIVSVDIDVVYPDKAIRVSHFRPFLDNLRIAHRHVLLVCRRLLPWPHKRLLPRKRNEFLMLLRHPVEFCRMLLGEHVSPAELGVSAGVGTFIAALPIFSLHTFVIVYVATRLNMNRIMAVAIQNLCVPPFVPFACIELGYFLRHGRWLVTLSMDTLIRQAPARLWEWLLGSLILGPLLAVMVGCCIFVLAGWVQKRQSR